MEYQAHLEYESISTILVRVLGIWDSVLQEVSMKK